MAGDGQGVAMLTAVVVVAAMLVMAAATATRRLEGPFRAGGPPPTPPPPPSIPHVPAPRRHVLQIYDKKPLIIRRLGLEPD